MSKRTRNQSAKHSKNSTAPAPSPIAAVPNVASTPSVASVSKAANVVAKTAIAAAPVEPKVPAAEQLRLAIGELRKSTALFLGTAITEVQQGAAVLIHELKERATQWFGTLKQPQRVARTNSVSSEQARNPVLS